MKEEVYKFTQSHLINLMKSNLNQYGIETSLTKGVLSIAFVENKDKMGFINYVVKIQRN